jgi:putative ABC transport system permease protein
MFDDLKIAWRGLLHARGFAAVAVATFALAIGANTAIFSVADAVLFRPLPYRDAGHVHILQWANRQTGARFALVEYDDLRAIGDLAGGVRGVGMLEPVNSAIVMGADGVETLSTVAVTTNYFQLLGVEATRGRLFDARDEAAPGRALILSHAAWRQRFGGDESVVGRPLTLAGQTFDVVGVLPPDFVFPSGMRSRPELVTVLPPAAPGAKGGAIHAIVRRDPGVSREQAQAQVDAAIAPLVRVRQPNDARTVVLEDVRSVLYPVGRGIMTLLVAAAGLVLLIGCANLANMQLARSRRRAREIGVHLALGASRARLVRLAILEALLIGVAGAVVAVGVTSATFEMWLRQVPPVAYGGAPVGVGVRVVLFAVGLGSLGALLFASVPAWRSASLDAQALLQNRSDSGRMRRTLGGPMIAAQVALAVVLVFGALIASRAFLSVLRVPLGFDPENIVTVSVVPRVPRGPARQEFYVRAVETLARRHDVVAVGAVGSMPLDSRAPDEGVEIAGVRQNLAGISHVLPGYFETLGIPLMRGRLLGWDDLRAGSDAAVLADAAARALFANRDPLGQTFSNGRGRQFTVVGVVADVQKSLDRPASYPVYVLPKDAPAPLTLVIRTRTRSEATRAGIKGDVNALAAATPVTVQWWEDVIRGLTAYRNPRFQTLVLGSFAVLAIGLTGVGVFGIVAFLVATRTREMGIRLALGARAESLVRLIVRQSLAPVAVGLLFGLIATRWASRLAEAQLFKVETRDPVTLAVAALTVVAAALLAAYLPARRASRVDPAVVLRVE